MSEDDNLEQSLMSSPSSMPNAKTSTTATVNNVTYMLVRSSMPKARAEPTTSADEPKKESEVAEMDPEEDFEAISLMFSPSSSPKLATAPVAAPPVKPKGGAAKPYRSGH